MKTMSRGQIAVAISALAFSTATLRTDFGWGPQLHWGYKRLMRAEFNLYF